MSTTANEVWVSGQRLDLDEDTLLLPSFQANDRTKPDTIQSDYSPEFSVPGTTHNHLILRQAAHSQATSTAAYIRLPARLTSGGVETLPLAVLYVKGYSEGRYQLQLFGGNRRLVEALGEKRLRDLDFTRFNHLWNPANIAAGLPYAHWQANGWGYEVVDRGKPVDLEALDPYTLYPCVAGALVAQQLLTEAGFAADGLDTDPLFAALNISAATPFVFPEPYRSARSLLAGFSYYPVQPTDLNAAKRTRGQGHLSEFGWEKVRFNYTAAPPYHVPEPGVGGAYVNYAFQVPCLGYWDLQADLLIRFGCRYELPGEVSCTVEIRINGVAVVSTGDVYATSADPGYETKNLRVKKEHYLCQAGDVVEIYWKGDEHSTLGVGPFDPGWQIGPWGQQSVLPNADHLATEVQFKAALLAEFPAGGLVQLQDWLPDISQLEYFKAIMLLLGLTVQADAYTPLLRFTTGARVVANSIQAKDWTGKRDAYPGPAGLPERSLAYQFGDYGQRNTLAWQEDELVKPGYGDGVILVNDTALPLAYEMARLPFAASENSTRVAGVLSIPSYKATAPDVYDELTPKPRLTLRRPEPARSVQVIQVPANGPTPAVLLASSTCFSYFADGTAAVDLDMARLLPVYWADAVAMLDRAWALTERYRLTARDIAELDFSTPVYDAVLGDYFILNKVNEFDARRATTVELIRLNAAHLPQMPAVGDNEFYGGEFYTAEFY